MANSPIVSFRASGDLAGEFASRGDSISAVALRDSQRYYRAIPLALQEACIVEAEWNYLRDILNGTYLDDGNAARYLWAEVQDAEPAYAEKWEVNPDILAAKVRALPAFTRLAICDAVERWWREQR